MKAKIAPNVIKIGVHANLKNGYLNPLSILNSKKVDKSASFEHWFIQTLNEGQNSSKSHKNTCPCLSLEWVSKSTLKFEF